MSAIATTSTFEGEARSSLEYELVYYFERLVRDSDDEVFEDGMESKFSRGLVSKVLEHGMPTLVVIEQVILAQSTNAEVLGETLVQISAIDDPKTHDRRLTILIEALESEDVRIRDAASLGLESMQAASAIPAIETAMAREPSAQMRDNLATLISQLRKCE